MSEEKLLQRISEGRQYRRTPENFRTKESDSEMIVTGHACTFNEPYCLYDDGEFRIVEQIESGAFSQCDMSDVIMQYDHEGRVYARSSNNTLEIIPDEKGLYIEANLSGSHGGPGLYNDIRGGYINKMSFGFTVAGDNLERRAINDEGKIEYLRTITKVGKLYDVSAVSIPANDATDISARIFCDGVIAEIEAERLEKRAASDRLEAECIALLNL